MANKQKHYQPPPKNAELNSLQIEHLVETLCSYYYCNSFGEIGIKSNMGACLMAMQIGFTAYREHHFADHSHAFQAREEFLDIYRKLSKDNQDTLYALYGWERRFPPMLCLNFPKCHQLAYIAPSSPPGYTNGTPARPQTKTRPSRPYEPPRPLIEALADKPKKTDADKELIIQIIRECSQMKKQAIQDFYHIWKEQQ